MLLIQAPAASVAHLIAAARGVEVERIRSVPVGALAALRAWVDGLLSLSSPAPSSVGPGAGAGIRLHERIDAAVEREGLTLRGWAMAHGLPVSAVHDWARRSVIPSNLAIIPLAQALSVDVEALREAILVERRERSAGQAHPGIPIDTPEQARQVLAERGLSTPSSSSVGPGAGAGAECHGSHDSASGAA